MHHRGGRIGAPGDLRREARAFVWLLDFRGGMSYAEIGRATGHAPRTVREEIARARATEPPAGSDDGPPPWIRMTPIFPCTSFTPASACPHRGPLPAGSRLYCAVCHATGLDASIPPAAGARAASRPGPEPAPRGAA